MSLKQNRTIINGSLKIEICKLLECFAEFLSLNCGLFEDLSPLSSVSLASRGVGFAVWMMIGFSHMTHVVLVCFCPQGTCGDYYK